MYGITVELNQKFITLQRILRGYKKVAIAFSGGVDSTLLVAVANLTEDVEVVAITIWGQIHAQDEIDEARTLCQSLGVKHRVIEMDVLHLEAFVKHPEDRCYGCKRAVFSKIKEVASLEGDFVVVDGSNVDDLLDYRPGLRALVELNVHSPLKESNLTKQEIRELSAVLKLPTAKKAAFACLATRLPFYEPVTNEALRRIEASEGYLARLGFTQYRVRTHGDLARIELLKDEWVHILSETVMAEIDTAFKGFGFRYVALDLSGYKMGNMNGNMTIESGV
jgi:uncharacterized protein